MDLILWRHAEAEDAAPGQDDMSRRLTKRGEKQARRVAEWFLERRPQDLRILVSPAVRTRQTAAALGLPLVMEPRTAPGASAADLALTCGWPEADTSVMLIGHQPALGQLAASVLAMGCSDWNIRKGGLYWITRKKGAAVLLAVVDPDLA